MIVYSVRFLGIKQGVLWMLLLICSHQLFAQVPKVSKNFLMGKYNYSKDTSFIKVANKYSDRTVYLKKQAYRKYMEMYNAALRDHITLSIISGTRSFYDQTYKWESKWNSAEFSSIKNTTTKASRLLRWWSMPGTSRHHWGTDIDLVNMKLAFYKTAEGKRTYAWLVKNAPKYGFQQPFNAGRATGYQEEKWHWSYVPLAKGYLKAYLAEIKYQDFDGLYYSTDARKLDVIRNYVSSVNPTCK